MQYLYIYDLSEWKVRLEEGWLGEKYVFGLWFVGEGRTRSYVLCKFIYIYQDIIVHWINIYKISLSPPSPPPPPPPPPPTKIIGMSTKIKFSKLGGCL